MGAALAVPVGEVQVLPCQGAELRDQVRVGIAAVFFGSVGVFHGFGVDQDEIALLFREGDLHLIAVGIIFLVQIRVAELVSDEFRDPDPQQAVADADPEADQADRAIVRAADPAHQPQGRRGEQAPQAALAQPVFDKLGIGPLNGDLQMEDDLLEAGQAEVIEGPSGGEGQHKADEGQNKHGGSFPGGEKCTFPLSAACINTP